LSFRFAAQEVYFNHPGIAEGSGAIHSSVAEEQKSDMVSAHGFTSWIGTRT
jgi:hypothetical protein